MKMLHTLADAVREHKADAGFGFDGDGDRCGVVDNEGKEIFGRQDRRHHRPRSCRPPPPNAQFVVDVKSTGLS